jgi:hypothetical protein
MNLARFYELSKKSEKKRALKSVVQETTTAYYVCNFKYPNG